MTMTAGLDWAQDQHAVCVVDDQGKPVLELNVLHTPEG